MKTTPKRYNHRMIIQVDVELFDYLKEVSDSTGQNVASYIRGLIIKDKKNA